MAHNIAECKVMARVSEETGLHCATGHQRHYSVRCTTMPSTCCGLGCWANCTTFRRSGTAGNVPGRDSWQVPLPGR